MSERRAFVCKKRESQKCNLRVFLNPSDPPDFVPSCPEHGKMERESNKPYRGGKRDRRH